CSVFAFLCCFLWCVVFAGAALVAVAAGAGVVAVSAAKAAEERPIAAATTRANTFFIVIPSIWFFMQPHCGAVVMTISWGMTGFREWLVSACNDMYKYSGNYIGDNNVL